MKLLARKKRIKVSLSDSVYIQGLSQSQIDSIEKDLTFSNPQYAQVIKYSKWSTTRVPQYLCYFEHISEFDKDIVKLPLGYFTPAKFDLSRCSIDDQRVYEKTFFPKFQLELRETQKRALEAYLFSNRDMNLFESSIQLPTGKGKTILGIALAHELKAKTLIVVHKVDLINSWKKDIDKAFNSEAEVGIIRAKKREVGEQFTIATVQTLNKLKPSELKVLYKMFGLVILDECHHCPSSSFSLVNNFKSRYRLGLSATPERNDGLTHIIKLYFGNFCYNYSKSNDSREKDILPFQVYRQKVNTYYDPICIQTRSGYKIADYDRKENFNQNYEPIKLEKRLSKVPYKDRPNPSYLSMDKAVTLNPKTSTMVINDVLSEYSKGHSCLVLFKQIDVLLEYFRLLLDRGVKESDIGLYYGGNNKSDLVAEQAEKQRKYITLATYSKASEGTNVQQWEVAFLVSSINNGKDVEQSVGRIRRIKENGDKLSTALVYDYRLPNVTVLSRHGETRDARYRQMSSTKFSRGF